MAKKTSKPAKKKAAADHPREPGEKVIDDALAAALSPHLAAKNPPQEEPPAEDASGRLFLESSMAMDCRNVFALWRGQPAGKGKTAIGIRLVVTALTYLRCHVAADADVDFFGLIDIAEKHTALLAEVFLALPLGPGEPLPDVDSIGDVLQGPQSDALAAARLSSEDVTTLMRLLAATCQ